MKKILLYFCVVAVIVLLIITLLYCFSYHEKNDYSQVSTIYCSGPNRYIKCDTENEIKNMESRIRKLNFYPSDIEYLSESPEYSIAIVYKDGIKKQIDITGSEAVVYFHSNDGEEPQGLPRFYYVNPLAVSLLFL